VKLRNGKTASEMGIPSSVAPGHNGLSCGRIGAATADLAAFYLKRINVPKRIDHPLPSWLQFPTAGSIRLPENFRKMHIDFSRKFSPMINGVFNEQIYDQMVRSSYLDAKLKLFS